MHLIVILFCDVPRLDVIVVKLNVKLLIFACSGNEIAHIDDVDEGEAPTGHEHFIVVEDEEYLIADLL